MNDIDRLDVSELDVSLKHLYYFVVTAEEGSITRASQRLYITQPTLSKHIIALEDKVGAPLFLRSERALMLTRQGRFFYTKWRDMLLTFATDFTQGRAMTAAPVDVLRIGCFGVLNFHRFLRSYTDRLSFRYPDVSYEMESADYVTLLDRLNSRALDVVFLLDCDLPDNRERYECRVVSRAGVVAAISSANPLGSMNSLPITRLSDEQLLIAESAGTLSRRDAHLSALTELGLRSENLRCVNSYLTAYAEAEHGRGVALGVRAIFPAHSDRVSVLDVEGLTVGITAVWNKNAPDELKGLIREFLE